jgi:invasion protein IalB
MRFAAAVLTGICLHLAGPADAQDLQGRDTAGNWRVTHHTSHGIWKAICDEREEDGALKQRCYIRWVDVYAGHPDFGAIFTFITPRENAPAGQHDVMFGPELGTVFLPNGFVIKKDDEIIWRMSGAGCLLLANCDLGAVRSDDVLRAMLNGTALELSFVDPHFRRFDLSWSLEGFPDAFGVYQTQLRIRQQAGKAETTSVTGEDGG